MPYENKNKKEKGWAKYGLMMKEAFNMNIQQKERKLELEKQRNNYIKKQYDISELDHLRKEEELKIACVQEDQKREHDYLLITEKKQNFTKSLKSYVKYHMSYVTIFMAFTILIKL